MENKDKYYTLANDLLFRYIAQHMTEDILSYEIEVIYKNEGNIIPAYEYYAYIKLFSATRNISYISNITCEIYSRTLDKYLTTEELYKVCNIDEKKLMDIVFSDSNQYIKHSNDDSEELYKVCNIDEKKLMDIAFSDSNQDIKHSNDDSEELYKVCNIDEKKLMDIAFSDSNQDIKHSNDDSEDDYLVKRKRYDE